MAAVLEGSQGEPEAKSQRRQAPHSGCGKPRGRSELCSSRSQAQEHYIYYPQSHRNKVQNQAKLTDGKRKSVPVVTQREMAVAHERGSREPSVLHADGVRHTDGAHT